MSVIRKEVVINAATTETNLLAGSKFEFLGRNSVVEVFACQDGADPGTVSMDVSFGNVLEGDDLDIATHTATLGPERDKHKVISAVAQAGDRIQLKVTNSDAANNSNLRYLVVITAL